MSASRQPQLFDLQPAPPEDLPEGFVYRPDFISPAEEAELARWLASLPFEPFQFRGFEGRRRVISFGWRYDFNRTHLERADDIPAELATLRARAEAFAGLPPGGLQQVLINEYQEGAPIGWHRDRPVFDKVVGVSVGAACPLRLRRRLEGGGFERRTVTLQPRSAYLLSGPARTQWEHSIPPVEAHRYSITFRSFRNAAAP
jgi:alkylated DNA repair dioxygenase AlkB